MLIAVFRPALVGNLGPQNRPFNRRSQAAAPFLIVQRLDPICQLVVSGMPCAFGPPAETLRAYSRERLEE